MRDSAVLNVIGVMTSDIYIDANTAIRDLVPMVPVAHGGSAVAFRASIEGAVASPLGNEYFAVMSDPDDDTLIWVQNGEPKIGQKSSIRGPRPKFLTSR